MENDKNVKYATRLVRKWNYSLSQVKSKLIKKGLSKKEITRIINCLKESSILDDQVLFKNMVYTYNVKNYGYIRIRDELVKKGFPKKLLESYEFDGEIELKKADSQFVRYKKRYEDYKTNKDSLNKLINALKRLGFSFSTIDELLFRENLNYENVE